MLCSTCYREAKMRCKGCHLTPYCDPKCQRLDWPLHKAECKAPHGYDAAALCRALADHLISSHPEATKQRAALATQVAEMRKQTTIHGIAVRANHAWEARVMLKGNLLFNCNFLTSAEQYKDMLEEEVNLETHFVLYVEVKLPQEELYQSLARIVAQ